MVFYREIAQLSRLEIDHQLTVGRTAVKGQYPIYIGEELSPLNSPRSDASLAEVPVKAVAIRSNLVDGAPSEINRVEIPE